MHTVSNTYQNISSLDLFCDLHGKTVATVRIQVAMHAKQPHFIIRELIYSVS